MTDTVAWQAGSVDLRRASAADAVAAAEVLILSREASIGAIPAAVHSDEEIKRWVETGLIPHCDVWIAEAESSHVLALLVLDEDWIDQLYVRPEAAGLGIGSRLIELAKRERPDGLQLRTFATNAGAQRFYERHGFVIAEQNAGSRNEEKQPDLRYVWFGAQD
ncbi:GNAT family N-acetyltransferase [Parafrigoribacterium soli]|uniref:GNAT family N-acetyltransferase n=1 Tax=Parafrigoribacterium soli TaxID=3144663 RepID=UPI0032EACA5C